MESNQPFDKMQYLKLAVGQFINKESAEDVDKIYFQLISQLPVHLKQNQIKRNIIEKCRDLFRSQNLRETIANARKKGVPKTELISIAVNQLAFVALGRHYDMSNLCCEGMVSTVIPSSKTNKKDNNNEKENLSPDTIQVKDLQGNAISIKYLDTINFKTGNIDEYIKKYKITHYVGEKSLPSVDVYTDLDFSRLSIEDQNTEYYRAVANHLLSIENIEYSHTNGYIGGLTVTDDKTRSKVGEEHFEAESNNKFSSYRVQVSPNYAAYYNRLEYEAVMLYLQQEQEKEKRKDDGR